MTSQELGQRIRSRRRFLRLRQRDLAEIAGVTLRGLIQLEKEANPTFKQLTKIADVLGLQIHLIERSIHATG